MTVAELFALPSDPNGMDRWLFSGELVERHNRNRFHSPGHSSAVMAISALLGGWSRIAGAGRFRAYGYGCPYLLGREPDTLISFDASLARQTTATCRNALYIAGAPALGIEIIELGEDPEMIARLVSESLRLGVGEVWVIDPVEERVTTHDPAGRACYANGKLQVAVGTDWPPFCCSVAEIFE